jgi:ABC-type branched-subunit amino acid transport system ATPase component
MSILLVEDLGIAFGGLVAVDGVTLRSSRARFSR